MDGDFAMLTAQEMLTQNADELKRTVADRREAAAENRDNRGGAGGGPAGNRGGAAEGAADSAGAATAANNSNANNSNAAAATSMDMDAAGPLEIPASHVTTLEGHASEVFICAWSPTAPLLASGSVSFMLANAVSYCSEVLDMVDTGGSSLPFKL